MVATIRSVLDQKDVDFEFVVVDDASSDQTWEDLSRLAESDHRLVLVRNPTNLGLTRSLIAGCKVARGRFIARQDCGDQSLENRFYLQLEALRSNPALAFVSCWCRYTSVDGHFLYDHKGSGRSVLPTDIVDLTSKHGVVDGPSHHGSVMFRRDMYEAVGGYRDAFYYGQDWDLWYRLALAGKFQTVAATLYSATIGPDDLSMRNKARQSRIGALALEALRCRIAQESEDAILERAAMIRPGKVGMLKQASVGSGHYFIGECLRRNGESELARRELRAAVARDPWHWRARLRLLQLRLGR